VAHDITLLLHAAETGEAGAADRLMAAVYDELRGLARMRLSAEHDNRTLQPTALVHEAWLRLGGDQPPPWHSRAHFFSAAAEAMRRILIDRARQRHRLRRGGGARPVTLTDDVALTIDAEAGNLLAVDEALARLAVLAPEQAELVKLRYYAGLAPAEAARVLGISESTGRRWWQFARAWLFREIQR
jgi:RNA polymerase sigma factor (TIGR02999 family)